MAGYCSTKPPHCKPHYLSHCLTAVARLQSLIHIHHFHQTYQWHVPFRVCARCALLVFPFTLNQTLLCNKTISRCKFFISTLSLGSINVEWSAHQIVPIYKSGSKNQPLSFTPFTFKSYRNRSTITFLSEPFSPVQFGWQIFLTTTLLILRLKPVNILQLWMLCYLDIQYIQNAFAPHKKCMYQNCYSLFQYITGQYS